MKKTRSSIRKVLCGCKRPMEKFKIYVWVLETQGNIPNFCVGVRDPWSYLEFLCGVRDMWSYPKSLCGCKRPVEKSEISVWV